MVKESPNIKALFSSGLAADQILDSSADLEFYCKDSCKEFKAAPCIVLLPKSTEQVVSIVKTCARHKLAIVPSGGRTGYSGGATARHGEVVVSLSKMSRIHKIDPVDRTVICEAGVTTEHLQQKCAEAGLYYPVDFPSKGSSQIGGNIATNAGGIRVVRYGNTRDWVLSLKVVTASADILNLNGSLFKNNTGYDLRALFIGSEGTLGIIVEAILKLALPPGESALALLAFDDFDKILSVLEETRKAGFVVNVFEYFERNALNRVTMFHKLPDPFKGAHLSFALVEAEVSIGRSKEDFEEHLVELSERGLCANVVAAQSHKQSKELMSYRELISDTLTKQSLPHKNDISVAVGDIPSFMKEIRALISKLYPDFEVVIFVHGT